MDSKENIILGSDIPKIILDNENNLSEHFIRLLSELGNRTALVDAHRNTSFTFDNILDMSYNVANWLKFDCGVNPSDVIAICCDNTIWYPSFVLGIWHVGGICALLNPFYNSDEMVHALNTAKPIIIIASPRCWDLIIHSVRTMDFIRYVYPIGLISGIIREIEPLYFEPTFFDNNHTSVILFTTGTDGLPKGVELTHRSLFLTISTLNKVNKLVSNTDIMTGFIPMFHGYGLLLLCLCMEVGSKFIVLKYFEKDSFLQSIQNFKPTVMFTAPPVMLFLAKSPAIETYDLSSLKIIYCGIDPVADDIQKEVGSRIGKTKPVKILQGYGMTELSIVAMVNNNSNMVIDNSVGKIISGMSVKVIDTVNGQTLGINKPGELCFKGPMVMKGYYNNSEETLATIDSEGWLHSGDVGYYDEDNNFHITHKIKELITYNGCQILPTELESLLLTHPDIYDVAIIDTTHPTEGEVLMAFVIKPDTSDLTEEDIVEFFDNQVSPQKRLRGGIQFTSYIPRSPSGKILRNILRDLVDKCRL